MSILRKDGILRKDDPTSTKFANRMIACLADLTSRGKQDWHVNDPGTRYGTVIGLWGVHIEGGEIRFHNGWGGKSVEGSHSLGATQTGRLLNLLVTVPGTREADQELRAIQADAELEQRAVEVAGVHPWD